MRMIRNIKKVSISPANHYAQDAKVDVNAYVCNILVALTQIVFTAVSMFLVDR